MATPGDPKQLPKSLENLLLDPRFPGTVRHLRRLYRDPMTGGGWGLARRPEGGIEGVHSLSEVAPFRTHAFPEGMEAFEDKTAYREWLFRFSEDTPLAAEPKVSTLAEPSAPGFGRPRAPAGPVPDKED